MADVVRKSTTIPSGTALSSEVKMEGYRLTGIIMPSAWTTAGISFQHGVDKNTFQNIFDDTDTEALVGETSASPDQTIGFEEPLQKSLSAITTRLRLRSGSSSVAVNQAADRELTLLCTKD